MKNNYPKPIFLGVILAAAMATFPVATFAQANAVDPSAPALVKPDNRLTKNLSGKVAAKTDTTLTVDGRTVSITSATTFHRSGASIGSGDVKVGDSINIVTTDDGQVAVSVDVLPSP